MSERFRPTRAGVINVWDYRDEEFVFADGRLVLRGPNGSGKTKAMEVLFPFVLDGRIEPRRLNPFSGEDRTMKSNLLYRGQDAAHAYVWMEFARAGEAVTVGVGMRAQRHTDRVIRWYFVVDGRVGLDFSLLGPDDRPLTRKQLADEVGADRVRDRPVEHRTAVDTRLFGLGADRYEQMLTLVLTLRRPQLARDLDPARLSTTLAEGLRPLDEGLLVEAARSFEDMESVQQTLEGLVRADTAASAFLAGYTTYLRTHARKAIDDLTHRRDEVERRRVTLVTALTDRRAAAAARTGAEQGLTDAGDELRRATAHLRSLERSDAYQHKGQLEKLTELVERLEAGAERERRQAEQARNGAERAAAELAGVRRQLADASAEVARIVTALAAAAADAGVGWSAEDSAADAFDERIAARVLARRDDAQALEEALAELRDARQERSRAEEHVGEAERRLADAVAAEQAAAEAVATVRIEVAEALTEWVQTHRGLLDELGTADAADRLRAGLADIGHPDTPGLPALFDAGVAEPVAERRAGLHRLQAGREAAIGELQAIEEQRREIAAERDDAPPPFAARTAHRQDQPGAPLWRLVRFADGVDEATQAAVEAALESANLLDAWVHPGNEPTVASRESDGYLLPADPAPGPTLADVLVPEEQDDVSAERITAVLSSVALSDVDGLAAVPTVSRSGRFSQGIQIGGHAKAQPEYVGATARARRRATRLAECDRRIEGQRSLIAGIRRDIEAATAVLDGVAAAAKALPSTGGIIAAERRHGEAAARLSVRHDGLDAARNALDRAVAAAGDRERRLHRVAAERGIAPATSNELGRLALALEHFQKTGYALASERRTEGHWHQQTRQAESRQAETAETAVQLAEFARRAAEQHADEAEQLSTLEQSVGADVAALTAQMRQTRGRIEQANGKERAARKAQEDAIGAEAAAGQAVTGAADALTTALVEEQTDAAKLAPYSTPELLGLLRAPADLARPGRAEDWPDPGGLCAAFTDDPQETVTALPEPVVRLHEALRAATRDLSPSDASLKSSVTRLNTALNDLQSHLSAAGQDYRPEWDSIEGVIVVRVADEQGLAPIGTFARRIAEARRDQELLLTDAERRVLEDALLGRLAQQIHDRTVDARDLIDRMSTQMRARRMSSGTTVGVTWELADSLDDEQRAVCRLLERGAARLAPEELARMRAHFAAQIKTARAQRQDTSYRDLLADVLDYRRWRTFVFWLVQGDRDEERLTRARHSKLSGGEQSVSLHLPLFAAAHAMLSSAHPDCPRLLALDEAFAGVDDTGRRELLGLTAQFDLDLFMTGYDLWAAFDTIPACSHYDLSHSAAEHTVSPLLLVFDGTKLISDTAAADLAASLGSPGRRRRRSGFEDALPDA